MDKAHSDEDSDSGLSMMCPLELAPGEASIGLVLAELSLGSSMEMGKGCLTVEGSGREEAVVFVEGSLSKLGSEDSPLDDSASRVS